MKIKVDINGTAYEVNIKDIKERPVIAEIDGEQYQVWPETESPAKSTTMERPEVSVPEPVEGASPMARTPQAGDSTKLTAPLPGVIMAILVKPGERIQRGQEVCTLEAMKMKNAIKSNRDGKIATVEVNVGDQVQHGQVLMTYED